MSGHVAALYHNLYDAGRAIEDLVASGIAPGEISLVTSKARAPILRAEYDEGTLEPAAGCGAIGGALGAIGAHLSSSPGGGDGLLATGPVLTSLATFTTNGGLAGSLRNIGISKRESEFCAREIRKHDALMVGVACLRHEPVVIRNILERHHATLVAEPARA